MEKLITRRRKRNSSYIQNLMEETNYISTPQEKLEKGDYERIRNEILKQLQEILQKKQLKNPNENFKLFEQNEKEDEVMEKLEALEKRAKFYGIRQIPKIVNSAIGKRILNLHLQQKQKQNMNKKKKKELIEESLRDYKIKNQNFLVERRKKLKQNTLIVEPYKSGRGFLQNPKGYEKRIPESFFQECQYSKVVKQVNKIFYSNLNSSNALQNSKTIDFLTVGTVVLFIIVSIILICLLCVFFQNAEFLVITFLTLFSIFILILGFKQFFNECGQKQISQIQLIKSKVKKYFYELNMENKTKGKDCQWIVPQKFIHLQVKFERNIFRR